VDDRPPYRLSELIGEGASAYVYAATLANDDIELVVKVLKPELAADPVARGRFLREGRAAAAVRHPRLVPVVASGEWRDGPWLALPRAAGNLAGRLRAGPLEPAAVARLAEDLAGGLDALHAAGIVHRDLKPTNVLLARDGTASIADFGLATRTDWTLLTRGGELLGTPHYVAPELIEGAAASPASDLYAYGCVLWEALTGAPPFAGRSLYEVGVAHLHEEPAAPAHLPPDVVFALRAPLAKRPQERPPTAHAAAALVRVAISSARPA
jgi:serine/threonine protein kinase